MNKSYAISKNQIIAYSLGIINPSPRNEKSTKKSGYRLDNSYSLKLYKIYIHKIILSTKLEYPSLFLLEDLMSTKLVI